ncbi:PLDc N-terminal domain-containing protein [Congregibacter variabilis]|uniref:PLDc N-terminal domain-containing protein n=1 Tax=Congregibacter variabilis TaxID=3081200 RepID=A0ABZ0HY98_9GAMM|nr:PLDc N-terminal domain-containing protein [Congregibacter sp. IMCC43200]
MGVEVQGVFGFLILVANVWAIISIVQSKASTGAKVLWSVLVLLLPILGLIIWFFAGPRSAAK